ncbi:hypothetical protein DPM19_18105 [Actinomadura craniellae]|uniref:Uncharacterized protein n=1 Tax=Actinomadura craniellae TaxID=2231787 RepID=A0A365H3L9_9ACTN|nr:hypothetical protein [Actinomadura craniellae]RAY13592.1 hypothetical protein DPM19_18105 [Actinomadura craniellae]
MIMLVAAMIAVLVPSGIGARIGGGIGSAICQVTSDENCEPAGQTPATPTPAPSPPRQEGAPPQDRPAPTENEDEDDGECRGNIFQKGLCHTGGFFSDVGDAVWDDVIEPTGMTFKGIGLGLWDTVTGAWDGVTFVGCLVHLCSHDAFKENWGGLKTLVTTNPAETLPVLWDEMTKQCREWSNEQVARCATGIIGSILGAKGLNKLSKLGKLPGSRGTPADTPPRRPIVDPEHLRRIADRIGQPVQVFVPRRGYELPYTSPPTVRVFGAPGPLDFGTLDPNSRYLWLVDTDGNLRLAPEESPEYAALYPKRPGNQLKHADLAAGAIPPGHVVPYGMRPPGRAAGELVAERGPDGRPTGRWVMDLNSSYAYSSTRMDGRALQPDSLYAVGDLLKATGTDTSKLVLEPRYGPRR